jgi:23S rRNA (cytosine1962-C5)-methyltransferase
MRAVVKLRPGHVQPVWTGHPWVFAQAIDSVDGTPQAGDVVDVVDPRGSMLGRGLWSPGSSVPVRIYTRRDEAIDVRLFEERFDRALELRRDVLHLPSAETTGYRLVHGEGDGLPGLIVDVYDRVVAVQALTVGVERRLATLVGPLAERVGARVVLSVPAPARIADREGLVRGEGVLQGTLDGPPTFRERGLVLTAQVGGQKTGYYLDQRENRALVEELARGRRVLDLFTFTGGFALSAARGGAREVVAVDSSLTALERAAEHATANGLAERIHFHRGDVRKNLGGVADKGEPFDLVILDPPKLAERRKDLTSALRLYRHLNAMAMRRLAPGGLLVTCSCSQLVSGSDFVRTVSLAARDAGRPASILRTSSQGPDHPVPVAFAEGRYLKLLLLHVP